MTARVLEQLRSEILSLSETERAELAHTLIQSLDAPADSDVEKAWDHEISRRLKEIDEGQAALMHRSEFRKRMQAKLEA